MFYFLPQLGATVSQGLLAQCVVVNGTVNFKEYIFFPRVSKTPQTHTKNSTPPPFQKVEMFCNALNAKSSELTTVLS